MTTTTIKAIRATIKLGNIELDVYQLPDGEYFMSLTQIAQTINIDKKRLSELRELNMAQTLYPQGFQESETVKVENGTKPVQRVSLEDVSKYWMLAAMQTQNQIAMMLLAASQTEALERRADAAFGVQRSEAERNQRLKARTKGIVARRTLTDAIKDYLDRHPDLSVNYHRYIWSNCSDHLNVIILGAKAKQAKENLGIPETSLLRNHIPIKALDELERVEDMASRMIDNKDIEPLEAVKQAAILMMARTIGLGD